MNKIRALFSDVDGTLCPPFLFFTSKGEKIKIFHVRDGLGIVEWRRKGLIFGVLSGRDSRVLRKRLKELGIKEVGLRVEDKLSWMEKWRKKKKLSWEEIGYIGDDKNDIALLKKVGFSASPSDAIEEVKKVVDFVSSFKGGEGCVREVIDYLLSQKEKRSLRG